MMTHTLFLLLCLSVVIHALEHVSFKPYLTDVPKSPEDH